jgi:glycosyltransferase involved in cell wall biosynthesis
MIDTVRSGTELEHLKSGNVPITYFEVTQFPGLSHFRSSPTLSRSICAAVSATDIIHNHGLWLFPNFYAAWHLKRSPHSTAKIVHSPRGMLGKAARRISAWKKEPVWWLWQRAALQAAHCLHATAESEYHEIRQAGLRNPVAIIPNGIDIPSLPTAQRGNRENKTILSLGRIHPKKGLDRLVRAWALLEDRFPKWSLRIVGSPEVGHDVELVELGKRLNLKRFTVDAAAYGDAKWQVYQEADLFVLPTLNENFGITVAEALACELPVISTKGAPWEGLEQEKCGWWIDHGVEPLASTLVKAIALDEAARAEMGKRGKEWMGRDFGWPAIGEEMANLYRWLHLGGPVPTSVRLT